MNAPDGADRNQADRDRVNRDRADWDRADWDRADWDRVESVFHDLVGLTPTERAAQLDERCGDDTELRREVEELLRASDRSGGFMNRSVMDAVDAPTSSEQRVGPWRLGAMLGRGGMGVVHRATRADGDFEQHVAIKLIQDRVAEPALVARFNRERRILAALEHPNIARLVDGGVTDDGQPYLAMELVDGEPLTAFCDARRLSIDARLGLFDAICDAVQHAHSRLVVHRDLKPANILIDDGGRPRLLDFGIASMLDSSRDATVTATVERRLTPQYASPEQLRGDPITTASDVYSLGLILYELLCGQRPYQLTGTGENDTRVVCDTTPLPPSRRVESTAVDGPGPDPAAVAAARQTDPGRLRRQLAGDLDTIVLKALRKEPDRRYSTVAALREDLERWRAGQPVSARPDSWAYRARLFVRRHRVGVAAACAVGLALVAGIAATTWQARIAERRRAEAVSALVTSDTVWQYLRSILIAADPREGGAEVTVHDALDAAVDRIEPELGDRPEVEARVREVIGSTYRTLGDHAASDPQLVRAHEVALVVFGAASTETARIAHELALLRIDQGRFAEAGPLLDAALAARVSALGPLADDTLETRMVLALVDDHEGRTEDARDQFAAVADARREILGPTAPETLVAQKQLAAMFRRLDQLSEAEALLRRTHDAQCETLGETHPDTLITAHEIGTTLRMMDRLDDAVAWLERATDGLRTHFPDGSLDVVIPRYNLAVALARLDRHDEAMAQLRPALEDGGATMGEGHYVVAMVRRELGANLLASGAPAAALPVLERAHADLRAALGPEHAYAQQAEELVAACRAELSTETPTDA